MAESPQNLFGSKRKPGCDEWSKSLTLDEMNQLDRVSDCSYLSLLFSPGHEIIAGAVEQFWDLLLVLPGNCSAIPGTLISGLFHSKSWQSLASLILTSVMLQVLEGSSWVPGWQWQDTGQCCTSQISLFRQEQAVISCPVVCFVFCFFEELFTLHPACLWARETLGLGLKLWTNRHETFSTACIISVVETYLCHNQLVERQYCLEWLLCHGVFLSGIHGSWNGSIFSSTRVGAVHTSQLVVTQYFGFLHSEVRPQSRKGTVLCKQGTSSCIWVLPADLGVGFVAVQLLIHMIWLVSKVDIPCFFSSQVLWHGLLPAVSDPRAANEAVIGSIKLLIVKRENTSSQILGYAIAVELVIAAYGSHSGGILSLAPLYIWSKNAFSLSLCSTR